MALEEDLILARQLIDSDKITQDQIDQCLKIVDQREKYGFRKPLKEVILELGFISPEELEDKSPSEEPVTEEPVTEEPVTEEPATEEPAAPKTLPAELEGFRIIRQIGKGSLGNVYEAEQLSLEKRVALKILKPHLAEKKEFVTNFLKEAKSAAKLIHKNIVQAISAGESNGFYYFAMEYVEGQNLREYVNEHGPLPEKKALEFTLKIAEGLSTAAANGFVHRDIKPSNIMVTIEGTVKIADFGLALPPEEKATASGTPSYMAPEQITNEGPVGIRSDIYSLGATLFHLLTGSPPFTGNSTKEILKSRLAGEVPPKVRAFRRDISLKTSHFVERLMSQKMNGRPQHPREIISFITNILPDNKKTSPPSAPVLTQRKRPAGNIPSTSKSSLSAKNAGRSIHRKKKTSSRREGSGYSRLQSKKVPRPGSRQGRAASFNEDNEVEDLDEKDIYKRHPSHRFTIIGLISGTFISLLILFLLINKGSTQIKQLEKPKPVSTKDQQNLLNDFQKRWKEIDKRAADNYNIFKGRPDLKGKGKVRQFRRLLYEHALSSEAQKFADELDKAREEVKLSGK